MMNFFKRKNDVEKARKELAPENTMYLGEKLVEVVKVTPEMFKKLSRVMENIPAFAFKLMNVADEETFQAYLIAAMDFIADEAVEVTHVLTGIEKEYLSNNVGISDIFQYLKAVADRNDITALVKNLMSLPAKEKADSK